MMTHCWLKHFGSNRNRKSGYTLAALVCLTAAIESWGQPNCDHMYPFEPLIVALPAGSVSNSCVVLLRTPTGKVTTNLLDSRAVLTDHTANGVTNSLFLAVNQNGPREDLLIQTGEYTVVVGCFTNKLEVVSPPPASQALDSLLRDTGLLLRIATIMRPTDVEEGTRTNCAAILARVTDGPYAEYARVFNAIDQLYQPFLNSEDYEGRPPPDFAGAAETFSRIVTPTGILRPTFLFHKGYALALAGRREQALETLNQFVAEFPNGTWASPARKLLAELIPEDQQAPTITILGPSPVTIECGGAYADAGATATDDKDGDITSRLVVENNVDTPKVGTYQVIYRVTDAAGNTATATRTVKVVYRFDGFLPPIGGADGTGGSFDKPLRTFKLGSTIPVKFKISCGGAAVKDGAHTLQVIKYNNATTASEPVDATPTDAATTGNQFRLVGDEWHFNLDTKATGMTTGTWQLKATLSDGSVHIVWIALK